MSRDWKLWLVSRPPPRRDNDEILVRPRRVGICGTDYHIFEGNTLSVAELTHCDGFDIVLDATGNLQSIEAGFAHGAHGGTYVLVSVVKGDINFADAEFHRREMSLLGSRNATAEDFGTVIGAIWAGAVPDGVDHSPDYADRGGCSPEGGRRARWFLYISTRSRCAMKSDTVYKAAFNQMLEYLASSEVGVALPSENDLSGRLGVSRTTVRKVLMEMASRGFLTGEGRSRVIARMPPGAARFSDAETTSTSNQVERQFMEWMLRGDTKPGTLINELEMARVFGVGTTGIREFLNRFQRFGLIEKRPNAGWLFKGFTEDFAIELFEIREMFETRSALALAALPPSAPVWSRLRSIEREHHDLLGSIDERFHDFSDLDNRFHRLVNTAVPNRFIDDFYDIITFIFHYHYQWNKRDERHRNEIAINEHLTYITALFTRDRDQVKAACNHHLTSAKTTMLRSFGR